MQFVYHPLAGDKELIIEGEQYIHLYKSRRTKSYENLKFRNLLDCSLYIYEQKYIERKSATLCLKECFNQPRIPQSNAHLILSVIDSKSLQKALPFLNELGVKTLSLFYAEFSQKSEKIDTEKLQKILIRSCEQCGRSDLMKLEIYQNLSEILQIYPNLGVFDFGGEKLNCKLPILIGPEGGFSSKEKEILANFPKFSTQESLILRSESVCVYVASLMQNLQEEIKNGVKRGT